MEDKGIWVFDIETLKNFFSYYAINRDTGEEIKFVIWGKYNQYSDLLTHLSKVKGLCGFNNISFDYPVLHRLIKGQSHLMQFNGDQLAREIYKIAQEVINTEYSSIRESDVVIPQLDLFKIWHYDNKARMTSLKKLEIALEFHNVQDMPYSHDKEIETIDQVKEILSYNKNDVEATKLFLSKTEDKLELRRGIGEKYGIDCMNYSDSKIGEQLMLKLYCQATGKSESVVRKQRTKRKKFKFSECIPSYIDFKTKEFNELLSYLKGVEVVTLKESFEYSFEYNGFQIDYGTGGVHGCIKAGVYESNDEYIIVDADIASMYPNLAITLNLYPEHLGEEFLDVYENGIVKPRIAAKRAGDKVAADGLKISANATYGKSNSEFSFLYDPLYTIKTTLGGQLAISMLCEMLMTRVKDLTMIQVNTDGLTVKIPVSEKRNYWNICKEWEVITKLELEYVAYSKMVIRDVNNYLAVSKDGKVKRKGAFKLNSEMKKDGEYHKSFSQGIVRTALSEYFLNNIPVEQTIKTCNNVFEFTKVGNTTGQWWAETFDKTDEGDINIERQQKNNRYLLSKSGKSFRKCTYKPDKETGEDKLTSTEYEADKLVRILNKYHGETVEDLDIDYQYYIDEAYKIIWKIDGTEERLALEAREKRESEKKEREEANFLKFCVNKKPTERQWNLYKKDWLIEKYVQANNYSKFEDYLLLENE